MARLLSPEVLVFLTDLADYLTLSWVRTLPQRVRLHLGRLLMKAQM